MHQHATLYSPSDLQHIARELSPLPLFNVPPSPPPLPPVVFLCTATSALEGDGPPVSVVIAVIKRHIFQVACGAGATFKRYVLEPKSKLNFHVTNAGQTGRG
jgi:hypothetical protein